MFFNPTEMDVELVERGEERAQRRAFGHFREGVDVLRKALAAVAELAIEPSMGSDPMDAWPSATIKTDFIFFGGYPSSNRSVTP